MSRECYDSYCYKGKQIEYINDEGDSVVTDEDCYTCNGTGLVGDECDCSAWNASECLCGVWDIKDEEE